MFGVLVFFHVTACLILIFIVLLQGGKGAELGAAFGGIGQAQGGRTPLSVIGKVTAVAAGLFMTTSLTLAFLSSERATDSAVKNIIVAEPLTKPETKPETMTEDENDEPEEIEQVDQLQLEQKDAPPVKE